MPQNYISRKQAQELIDAGLITYLEAALPGHLEYVQNRLERHWADENGKIPEWAKGAGWTRLEHGLVGSGLASPQFIRDVISSIMLYARGDAVIETRESFDRRLKDYRLKMEFTPFEEATLTQQQPRRSGQFFSKEYTEKDHSKPFKLSDYPHASGDIMNLEPERIKQAVADAAKFPSFRDDHLKEHSDIPSRWKIEELVENLIGEIGTAPEKSHPRINQSSAKQYRS